MIMLACASAVYMGIIKSEEKHQIKDRILTILVAGSKGYHERFSGQCGETV